MRIRDVRLAVLDNDVIHDLLRRPQVAKKRLGLLRREGLTLAITQRTLGEIVATPDSKKRERLRATAMSRADAYLDFEALDLVKVELKEEDPEAAIGARTLLSSRYIETLTYARRMWTRSPPRIGRYELAPRLTRLRQIQSKPSGDTQNRPLRDT